MSKRYGTRGVKVQVDPSLLKTTRAEQNAAKRQREEARAAEKQQKEDEKEEKKAQQSQQRKRIAQVQDRQAEEDKAILSVRPDLRDADNSSSLQLSHPASSPLPKSPSLVPPNISRPPSPIEDDGNNDNAMDGWVTPMDVDEFLPQMPPETESEGSAWDHGMGDDIDDSEPNDDPNGSPGPLNPHYDSDASDAYNPDAESDVSIDDEENGDATEASEEEKVVKKRTSGKKGKGNTQKKILTKEQEEFEAFRQWKAMEAAKESASRKRKEKAAAKKINKSSSRRDIDSKREIPPKAPGNSTGGALKRKNDGAEKNESESKRSKKSIGGLSSTWKKTAAENGAKRLSTTSMAEDIEPPGEFDSLETQESLQAARAAKATKKEEMGKEEQPVAGMRRRQRNRIHIVPANVQEIDGKEREKTATATRRSWSNKHLPLPSPADLNIWKKTVLPRILDYTATKDNLFASNSDINQLATVRKEWIRAFAHLPVHVEHEGKNIVRADHPAILRVAQAGCRTHRSEIGQAGVTVVSGLWQMPDMQSYKTMDLRKEWVRTQLRGGRWFYGNPDADPPEDDFRGPLVLEVFAFHVANVMDIPVEESHGNPNGALILCAIAVKRALLMWKSGSLEKETTNRRNTADSFKDAPWGQEAVAKFLPKAKALDDDAWEDIWAKCESIVEARRGSRAGSSTAAAITAGDDADDETFDDDF